MASASLPKSPVLPVTTSKASSHMRLHRAVLRQKQQQHQHQQPQTVNGNSDGDDDLMAIVAEIGLFPPEEHLPQESGPFKLATTAPHFPPSPSISAPSLSPFAEYLAATAASTGVSRAAAATAAAASASATAFPLQFAPKMQAPPRSQSDEIMSAWVDTSLLEDFDAADLPQETAEEASWAFHSADFEMATVPLESLSSSSFNPDVLSMSPLLDSFNMESHEDGRLFEGLESMGTQAEDLVSSAPSAAPASETKKQGRATRAATTKASRTTKRSTSAAPPTPASGVHSPFESQSSSTSNSADIATPSSSTSLSLANFKPQKPVPDDVAAELSLLKDPSLSSKERRALRNKLSARHFREKRKEYIETLEGELQRRDAEIAALKRQLEETREERQDLLNTVKELKAKLLSTRSSDTAALLSPSPALSSPPPLPPRPAEPNSTISSVSSIFDAQNFFADLLRSASSQHDLRRNAPLPFSNPPVNIHTLHTVQVNPSSNPSVPAPAPAPAVASLPTPESLVKQLMAFIEKLPSDEQGQQKPASTRPSRARRGGDGAGAPGVVSPISASHVRAAVSAAAVRPSTTLSTTPTPMPAVAPKNAAAPSVARAPALSVSDALVPDISRLGVAVLHELSARGSAGPNDSNSPERQGGEVAATASAAGGASPELGLLARMVVIMLLSRINAAKSVSAAAEAASSS
ncbi:hypothetical protein DFJ73DRAFT_798070 [Zopfochytrium polystomum]|nr:hypothetical protein DFJ73DRAFT_798070 [Zopfochytrium polystomum]